LSDIDFGFNDLDIYLHACKAMNDVSRKRFMFSFCSN